MGFKLLSAGKTVHVQAGRTWHSILRRNIITGKVGKPEAWSADREAGLIQPRGGEEGGMGLCAREKRDVLNYGRKLSSWVL